MKSWPEYRDVSGGGVMDRRLALGPLSTPDLADDAGGWDRHEVV